MEERSFVAVIKNPGFLNLWINQILVQLTYNALNFSLIIWVYKLVESNLAISLLLVAMYTPAILFGLFAGVLVDITDRKNMILLIDFCLGLLVFSLMIFKGSYPAILFITFVINTLSQFYAPTESSAIPLVVKRSQLITANSIFSTTLYICFLAGFALAGPILDRLGINYLFFLGGLMLAIATTLALFFPSIVSKADAEGQKLIKALEKRDLRSFRQVAWAEIHETLRMVKGHLAVLFCILIMAGAQVVIGILAVLIPSFFEKILHIRATNASYVLVMPLGLGMVLGGLLIGRLGHLWPKRTIVGRGVLLAGLLFLLVGISPFVAPVIKYLHPIPFTRQLPVSLIIAAGAFLLGIAMVSIVVPSQTVLQESTPEEDRGKVFAVLNTAMYGMSLLPVLFAGLIADIFGAMPLLIGLGGLILILGLFGLRPNFFFEEQHLPDHIREFLGLGHWQKES